MKFNFRRATTLDLERLLEWRNDSLTRLNSISADVVPRDVHEEWLKTSLESKERRLFIAEVKSISVGTVKLEQRESGWELSWTVAPTARGKGIGKEMVKEATQLVPGDLIARIKETNVASIHIAEHAGFRPVGRMGELIIFRFNKS